MVWLVRTVYGETEVVGLLGGHLGELDVELGQVGSGNLLVEGLGEHVDTERVGLGVGPEGNLGHDLVGERTGHDEGWVSSSTSEVDKSTLGEKDDVSAGRHGESVDLGLDVDGLGGSLLQPGNVNLNIEVADVADDGVLLHDLEVLADDDVSVTGGGNEDVGSWSSLLHSGDLVTGHGGLESVDGVDFGDNDSGTVGSEGLGTSLSDITETSDDGDLTGQHDIGGSLDTINKRLSASVVVVELGLGDGVVDVDGGDLELAVSESLVEVVNTGGGLLGDTSAVLEVLGVLLVDEGGKVSSVIEDQVEWLALWEGSKGLLDTQVVLLLGLTLPGEDWDTSDLGTECSKSLDKDGSLNGP